jgi:preprotein translocase subunit SecD
LQSRSNLFLVIVLALTALSVVGYIKKDYPLGIDIKGGIRLVYSVEQTPESKTAGNTLEHDRNVAIKTLTRRATSGIGVVESNVQAKGANQIVIEIPGYTNIAGRDR